MEKMNKLVMFAVVAAAAACPSFALTEKVGDYMWTYTTSSWTNYEGKVVVEATLGDGTNACVAPAPVGRIALPKKLGGCRVTGLANYAFKGCGGLTEVQIAENLDWADEKAFNGATALERIVVLNLNEYFFSYDGVLYAGDWNGAELVRVPEAYAKPDFTGLTKPTVEYVWPEAFRDCANLKTVTVNYYSMWGLGDATFAGCASFEEFIWESEFEYDGEKDWYPSCVRDGVLYDDEGTLLRWPTAKPFTGIPDGTQYVYDLAFAGNMTVSTVTLKKTGGECDDYWLEISPVAFMDCGNLKTIVYEYGAEPDLLWTLEDPDCETGVHLEKVIYPWQPITAEEWEGYDYQDHTGGVHHVTGYIADFKADFPASAVVFEKAKDPNLGATNMTFPYTTRWIDLEAYDFEAYADTLTTLTFDGPAPEGLWEILDICTNVTKIVYSANPIYRDYDGNEWMGWKTTMVELEQTYTNRFTFEQGAVPTEPQFYFEWSCENELSAFYGDDDVVYPCVWPAPKGELAIPNDFCYAGGEAFKGLTGVTSLTLPNGFEFSDEALDSLATCTNLAEINMPRPKFYLDWWYGFYSYDGILYDEEGNLVRVPPAWKGTNLFVNSWYSWENALVGCRNIQTLSIFSPEILFDLNLTGCDSLTAFAKANTVSYNSPCYDDDYYWDGYQIVDGALYGDYGDGLLSLELWPPAKKPIVLAKGTSEVYSDAFRFVIDPQSVTEFEIPVVDYGYGEVENCEVDLWDLAEEYGFTGIRKLVFQGYPEIDSDILNVISNLTEVVYPSHPRYAADWADVIANFADAGSSVTFTAQTPSEAEYVYYLDVWDEDDDGNILYGECCLGNGELPYAWPLLRGAYVIPGKIENCCVVGAYENAFANMTELTELTFPGSFYSLDAGEYLPGDWVWDEETQTHAYVTNGLPAVVYSPFTGCVKLAKLTFNGCVPENLAEALKQMPSVKEVRYPAVPWYGWAEFIDAFKLEHPDADVTFTQLSYDEEDGAYWAIDDSCLYGYEAWFDGEGRSQVFPGVWPIPSGDVTVPRQVAYIGENAFYGCSGITSVILPDTLECLDAWEDTPGFWDETNNTWVATGDPFVVSPFTGCANLAKLTFNGRCPDGLFELLALTPSIREVVYPATPWFADGWAEFIAGFKEEYPDASVTFTQAGMPTEPTFSYELDVWDEDYEGNPIDGECWLGDGEYLFGESYPYAWPFLSGVYEIPEKIDNCRVVGAYANAFANMTELTELVFPASFYQLTAGRYDQHVGFFISPEDIQSDVVVILFASNVKKSLRRAKVCLSGGTMVYWLTLEAVGDGDEWFGTCDVWWTGASETMQIHVKDNQISGSFLGSELVFGGTPQTFTYSPFTGCTKLARLTFNGSCPDGLAEALVQTPSIKEVVYPGTPWQLDDWNDFIADFTTSHSGVTFTMATSPETLWNIEWEYDDYGEKYGYLYGEAWEEGTNPVTRVGIPGVWPVPASGELVVPEGVVEIYDGAFVGCSGVTKLVLPGTLEYMDEGVLADLPDLQRIVVSSAVWTNAEGNVRYAWYRTDENGLLYDMEGGLVFCPPGIQGMVVLGDDCWNVYEGAFAGCTNVTELVLSGEKEIYDEAFAPCTALEKVTADVSVYGLAYAFGPDQRVALTLRPERWWECDCEDENGECPCDEDVCDETCGCPGTWHANGFVEEWFFEDADWIASLKVEDGVWGIAEGAFCDCSNLTEVEMPSSLDWMGEGVFAGCSNLAKVCYYGNAPYGCEWLYDGTPTTLVSYVKYGTTGWNGYEGDDALPSPAVWPVWGWDDERDVAEDETARAVVQATAAVNYYVDGALYQSSEIYVGTVPELPEMEKPGCTFSGWFKDEAKTEAADLDDVIAAFGDSRTFYGAFTPNVYTLVFDAAGGSDVAPITQDFGTAVTPPNPPTKMGYTFAGWTPALPATVPVGDTSYTARWAANGYVVTFDANGGNGEMDSESWTYDAATNLASCGFSRIGYTFAGWATNETGDVLFADGATVSNLTAVAGTRVTFFAIWNINEYTLAFDTVGGSDVAPITQDFGTAVTEPAAPTKKGYTFAGWVPEVPETIPAEDMTCTAQWTLNKYTLTFDTAGGSMIAPVMLDYGTAVTPPAAPRRKGYTFTGWTPEVPATMPDSDVRLTAQWKANRYTVTFIANGGTGTMATQTFAYDAEQHLSDCAFDRAAYEFIGWSLAADSDELAYFDGENVLNLTAAADGNVTLYAVWERTTLWAPVATGGGSASGGSAAETESGNAAFAGETAETYDGYVYTEDGVLKGTVQVKAAKAKLDRKTEKTLSKITVTIQLMGEKKVTARGNLDVVTAKFDSDAGGRALSLALGADGVTGTYGPYLIDGAQNKFMSRDANDKAVGAAVLARWQGVYAVACKDAAGWSGFSLTVAAKGKVKVQGVLADGTKVSTTSQLLVGEGGVCVIPVVIAKKANVAFNVWLTEDGMEVVGIDGEVVVGRLGTLAGGSRFGLEVEAFCTLLGDSTYADYLPGGVTVAQNGAKLIVADGAKAGKVQLVRGATLPSEVDVDKAGANPSALKFTYTVKTGLFKGTFKAYTLVNGKPKAVSVTVTGVMVGGTGYGAAAIKKVGGVPVVIGVAK